MLIPIDERGIHRFLELFTDFTIVALNGVMIDSDGLESKIHKDHEIW